MGIYLQSPGVTSAFPSATDMPGLQLGNQTVMKFTFNQNAEWFQNTNHNAGILLTLGKHYVDSSNKNCNVKLLAVFTPTSVSPTAYSIPLSSFVVNADCSIPGLTVASALAASPISQIDFQGDGGASALTAGSMSTSSNMTTATTTTPVLYPTTLVISGGVTFQ